VWDISKLPSTPSFLTSLELPSGKTISIKSDCSDAISADETRLAVLLSDQQTIRLWDNSVSPPQFRCDMSAGFFKPFFFFGHTDLVNRISNRLLVAMHQPVVRNVSSINVMNLRAHRLRFNNITVNTMIRLPVTCK
jgi:WD40 repeat protein